MTTKITPEEYAKAVRLANEIEKYPPPYSVGQAALLARALLSSRAMALEEAAKIYEDMWYRGEAGNFPIAIRALASTPTEGE